MLLIGKRGCLRRLIVFAVFALLIGFLISSVLKEQLILGVSVGDYKKFVEELKKPVNIETYAPDRISATDKETMLAEVKRCGLNIYNSDKDVFVTNTNLKLNETLTLNNKQFAHFINLGIKENYGTTFELISLKITLVPNKVKTFNYETITKLSTQSLKEQSNSLKDFPSEIYIKSTSEVQILGESLKSINNKIVINEIADETSKNMITMLDQMFKVGNLNITCTNFLNDTYLKYVNTCKTTISNNTPVTINSLQNNQFSFIKQ